ncbi:PAS domain S-box-containing protein [Rhizobium wenxiniae]|uniref:histidine kinase n=1 Tax=Rhizobium wenxiniae TaxID=1737357 RepID=A0A7W9YCU4_9HYPH|nr:PAS domain S-box-containing protein [Rhizobium wenxiniae]
MDTGGRLNDGTLSRRVIEPIKLLLSRLPDARYLGLFFFAYLLGCGFAQLLAVVPGTGISVWPPGGLFIATLLFAGKGTWPWWIISGAGAELAANALWFHSPFVAAAVMYIGNALAAMIGAWIVHRVAGQSHRFETLKEVVTLIVFAGGLAPIISATVGSVALAWFDIQSQSFTTAWPLWWIGDATGVLIVAPLALVVFQSWRDANRISIQRLIEAGALCLVLLGLAALTLSGYLPFAYIIMPPLLWAAVRFEFKGAAMALAILAVFTVLFAVSGGSQAVDDQLTEKHRQVMLQLFLAISAFSALVVAAVSREHQLALRTLEDSVETFRNREREFSQLVNMVPSYLWRLSAEGDPVFFSQRVVDFFGLDVGDYDTSEKKGLSAFIEALVHPEDAEGFAATLQQSFETGNPFSLKYRLRGKDGIYRWVAGRAEALRGDDGEIIQWYGLSQDIEDQVRSDKALHQSKQQLEQMLEAVPFNVLSFSPSGQMTYASQRYLKQAGTPSPHVKDFDALAREVVHPDDFPVMFARAKHGFVTGEPFINRFRRILTDGSYRWIEARAQPLRGKDGAIVQWYIASIDIEEEMKAQEALRERERFLWQLVETLPAMIDCAGPDGEPLYRSQQLREFLGYNLDALDGSGKTRLDGTLDSGVHPDDVAGVKEQYHHCLTTGEPYARRHRLRRHNGEYRWVETRAAPMRNDAGDIVQWNVICLDIDGEVWAQENLRMAQDSLARASQAASLAELSASIAHEVNQPLAAVMNYSNACQRWMTMDPPNIERAKKAVDRIIHSANSAADVVARIRALFKQDRDTRDSTSLDKIIFEIRDLLASEASRRGIRIELDLEVGLILAPFDRVQIQQVVMNLVRNAMDAMTSVSNRKTVTLKVHRNEDLVQVSVSDCGRGVQFPTKIFEPFFTTKDQGMGMGLSISRSIVEAHGGQLWSEKNEPQGAIFIFTLRAALDHID